MRTLRKIRDWLSAYYARRRGLTLGTGAFIAWRGKIIGAANARIILGNSVSIFENYRIEVGKGAVITLGNDVHFREGARLFAGDGAQISIGERCYFNHDVSIVAVDNISIGANSIFGPACYLSDNNHGIQKNRLIRDQLQTARPLQVGADVWMGVGATVLMGAGVADGAVIAARAVVTKQVPADEIWGGIPAKRLGERQD